MTDTKARRGAGRPREFNTDAALDKAVRLFWQRGYEATSMADLVAETGVAAASLYAAFDNKAGLFAAVIERYSATFSVHLYAPINDPALSTFEAVTGLLERAASTFSEPGTPAGCFMYSAAAAVSPASAAIECLLRDKRIAAEALLVERLHRGAAHGELAADADPAVLGKFFNTVMEGMSVQARDGATINELLSIAEMALDRWPLRFDRPGEIPAACFSTATDGCDTASNDATFVRSGDRHIGVPSTSSREY